MISLNLMCVYKKKINNCILMNRKTVLIMSASRFPMLPAGKQVFRFRRVKLTWTQKGCAVAHTKKNSAYFPSRVSKLLRHLYFPWPTLHRYLLISSVWFNRRIFKYREETKCPIQNMGSVEEQTFLLEDGLLEQVSIFSLSCSWLSFVNFVDSLWFGILELGKRSCCNE